MLFQSAKQKIKRANCHISDVEKIINNFVGEKPHRFSIYTDPNSHQVSIRVRFVLPVPEILAFVIGDAIHNLRCALDHMMWELVGLDRGTQDRNLSFPTHSNRVNFEAACQAVKTPSQWAKEAIRSTEAFRDGRGHDLYQISQLDNSDKHRAIIPVLRATSHPPLTIKNSAGNVVIRMEGNVIIGGTSDFTDIAVMRLGHSIELDDNAECPPSIFIQEVGNIIGLPVVCTLQRFSHAVGAVIDCVEGQVPI